MGYGSHIELWENCHYCMYYATAIPGEAPQKTVQTANLRGGTAETLNMFNTSQCHSGLGQSAAGSPRHRLDRRGTAMTAMAP